MSKNKDDIKKRLDFYKDKIDSADENFEKATTVIFDGRQYSIRIPKDFVEFAGVKKGDEFVFRLLIPPHDSKNKTRLTGEWLGKGD